MRTSISIDDRLAERVRRRAADEGKSVSAFIAQVLDDALKWRDDDPVPPFRLVAVGEGGAYANLDLDRARELLVAEDEERWGERGGEG